MFPILINLGPIQIRSYGIFLVLAFLVGTFLLWREGKKQGYNEDKLFDLSVLCILTGFVGSRLYYILINWGYYSARLSSVLKIWEGGLSLDGALIGGFIGLWWFNQRNKWPFFQVADFAVLAASLGIIVGKFGSFLNGDDYGLPSNLPWAVQIPGVIGKRHPSPIYEALVLLIIYNFLLRKYRAKQKSGGIFLSFVLLLGVSRFVTEIFRDNPTYLFGLKEGYWGAGVLVLIGSFGLYWFYNNKIVDDLLTKIQFSDILKKASLCVRRLGKINTLVNLLHIGQKIQGIKKKR